MGAEATQSDVTKVVVLWTKLFRNVRMYACIGVDCFTHLSYRCVVKVGKSFSPTDAFLFTTRTIALAPGLLLLTHVKVQY